MKSNKILNTLKHTSFICETPKTVSMIFPDEIKEIEKSLKALEIIKNKKVQVAYLHSMWDDFETTFNNNDEDVRWLYNEGRETDEQLAKDEYDLLKEVLE